MMTLRANHDTKLIMGSAETNALTWYITSYASKKQQCSSNVSALLAKRVAFHSVEERRCNDLTDVNKQLIQRCANTLTRDREFSGPEIMSYLMGWGDRFESHHYVAIYPDAIIAGLKERYPGLRRSGHSQRQVNHTPGTRSTDKSPTVAAVNNRTHIITMVSGVMTLKDQLHEYMFRGEEIAKMNLLTFILNTYDAKADHGDDESDPQQECTNLCPMLSGRLPN